MIFTLRLASEDFSLEFQSSLSTLRFQLSQAFLDFKAKRPAASAVLEVHHGVHGWSRVCIDQQYPLINNPFTLNFAMLRRAVLATLAECDSWPTEEEKAQRKIQLLAQERDERAQQRRKQFRVVQTKLTTQVSQ